MYSKAMQIQSSRNPAALSIFLLIFRNIPLGAAFNKPQRLGHIIKGYLAKKRCNHE